MTWINGPFCVFDLETTAPDPEEARIVTACVGTVAGGHDSRFKTWLVDPGVDIPDEATAIHGITTERAKTDGEPPDIAITSILEHIHTAWDDGHPVIGHNISYDLTVLDRELRRHNLGTLDVRGPVIDSMVLDRHVDTYRKGRRTLTATAEHYQVELNGAHDATQDAVASARIVWRIARQYPGIGAMTLTELHEAQIGWHRERQENFADYLRRKGKDVGDVSTAWPLRPQHENARQPGH